MHLGGPSQQSAARLLLAQQQQLRMFSGVALWWQGPGPGLPALATAASCVSAHAAGTTASCPAGRGVAPTLLCSPLYGAGSSQVSLVVSLALRLGDQSDLAAVGAIANQGLAGQAPVVGFLQGGRWGLSGAGDVEGLRGEHQEGHQQQLCTSTPPHSPCCCCSCCLRLVRKNSGTPVPRQPLRRSQPCCMLSASRQFLCCCVAVVQSALTKAARNTWL